MLLTITLILFGLVSLNLILLKVSCNKTEKTLKQDKKPVLLKSRLNSSIDFDEELAPTGS